MKIGDRYDFEPLIPQILYHLLKMREALRIHREGPVFLLIIDIEVNHIGRDSALAEFSGDFAHLRLGIIGVPALLVAQRAQRRNRHAADQLRELLDHTLGVGSREKVIVKIAALGPERIRIMTLFPKIKAAAISVVEKNAVGKAIAKSKYKGDIL